MDTDETKPAELTFEEIADQLYPSNPVISPDGRAVAFTVTSRSRKGEHTERAIWLSRDGKPAVRFSGGETDDHDVSFGPDGTRLAFLSNRKDPKASAIYLLPLDGGEAQRLGDLDGNLSTLKWAPDGKSLAVLRIDPDSDEEKKRKEDKEDPEVFEEELKFSRLWLVDADSGKARCLTMADRNVWDHAWLPESDGLVSITTPQNTLNSRFATATLWHVPVTGGLARQVAEFTPAPSSPVVREVDGEPVVALIASALRDDPSPSIWTVPLAGGAPVNLIPGQKGAMQSLIADPRTKDDLVARMVEGTHARLYGMSAQGGPLASVALPGLEAGGSILDGPAMSDDGGRIAFGWSRFDRPLEMYLRRVGNDAVAITSFGKGFEGRLTCGDVVTWTSDDEVHVEGVLLYPRGYEEGKRYPLLVQVHGGPSWQWEDRANLSWHDWGQMLTSRGYAVLLPNPRGSTGYGSDFERLLIDDVGGGESQDLVCGARAMVERGIADPDRLAIGGWSWGGYLTARTITQTGMFKAAIMGAGVANLASDHAAGDIAEANMAYYSGHPYTHWDLYADRSPVRHAANVTTPTLILHGGSDARVHPTQSMEFHRALQVLGVPVRFVRYPREGHGIAERHHQLDLMRRIVAWLERYV